MAILHQLVHACLQTRLRGLSRATAALARRAPALRAAPVQVGSYSPVYVDLRDKREVPVFRDSPYRSIPQNDQLHRAMRIVVRPGDVALDVGANRGLVSVALAALVGERGQVVAFEPNPALQANLRRTLGALPNARLEPYALGDAESEATLHVGYIHEVASLSAEYAERDCGTSVGVTCRVRRLDDLVATGEVPRPDFMKVDVEGAELLLFRGARATLDREDAPIVIYESNVFAAPMVTREPAPAATSYLLSLARARYQCFLLWNWNLVTRLVPGQYVHGNLLAIPEARLDRWPELAGTDVLEVDAARG